MFRKPKRLAILLAVTILGIVLGLLNHYIKKEPDFYRREQTQSATAENDDPNLARDVLEKLSDLMNDIRTPTVERASWGAHFTAEELNALFREKQGGNSPILNGLFGSLPDPRIDIQGNHLLVAFRKGSGFWSTVITIEVRFWLVLDQPNMVALEIVGLRAGSVPLPRNSLFDRITDAAYRQNVDVNWYRDGGNPVALCQLYANQPNAPMQLTTLKVEENGISIGGKHLYVNEK